MDLILDVGKRSPGRMCSSQMASLLFVCATNKQEWLFHVYVLACEQDLCSVRQVQSHVQSHTRMQIESCPLAAMQVRVRCKMHAKLLRTICSSSSHNPSDYSNESNSMPIHWDKRKQTVLSASIITGTSLKFLRKHCVDVQTGGPFYPPEDTDSIRTLKQRATGRSLEAFRRLAQRGPDKLPTSGFEPVPLSFRFENYIQIAAGSKETLPTFTREHYLSQFTSPISSTSSVHSKTVPVEPVTMPPTVLPTKARSPTTKARTSKKTNRGRSQVRAGSKTPPRAPRPPPSSDDVSDIASNLSKLGLSLKEQKNAKYALVDAQDKSIYDDTFELVDGIDNSYDIYARLLPHVKCKDGSMWMTIYQLIIPIVGFALNAAFLDTSMRLVRTACGRKAVELSSYISYNRMAADADAIAFDCEETFGASDGRESGLAGTLVAKKNGEPKGGYIRRILLILPDEHVNEDVDEAVDEDANDFEEDDDESIEGGVFYSNFAFSDVKGKEPLDGHLKCAMSIEVGDETSNFFFWGTQKVPVTTAYAVCQIALDGTQEDLTYKTPTATTANDPDAWRAARKKAMEDKANKKKQGI